MSNDSHTLYLINDYRCGDEYYKQGHVLEDLTKEKKDWYLRDAPGSFSEDKPEPEKPAKKAKGKPKKAQDKAIK